MKNGVNVASGHTDLTTDLISLHKEKPEFNSGWLRKMIVTNFGAGHETMASTLTSIMAMLGTHDDVARNLREEIDQTAESRRFAVASRMPYAQAVIKECKRVHPVLAMALPRRVPQQGLVLHDYYFPPGTTVGCSPVSLHRNESICGPDPDAFNPQRWLDGESRAKEMEVHSLAWGGGARSCPGRHLAELIVDKAVTALLAEFHVLADVPPDDEMPSYFLSMMTGVKARFIPRRSTGKVSL